MRAFAAIIGCDIHPLNNRRALEHLRWKLDCDEGQIGEWCSTWIGAGFDALESLLRTDGKAGPYCFGHQLTLADVYLVPQVESARRFKVDMARWPLISKIDATCGQLEAFARAAPAVQPDAS